ncbi:MAG: hypothetical protein Q8O00_00890 [Holophaga sp.]|nr:hypothetical protein [Holophaga sp.]
MIPGFEARWAAEWVHTRAMRPATPSPKLIALQKDFQQIASMAGYLNSSFDLPQLRLFFTLYGRMTVKNEAEGLEITPTLQAWCERVSAQLREDSSGSIMPPQVQVSAPQPLPNGESWYVVGNLSFNTKVTETSYQRIRTAVLAAYQAASVLREKGVIPSPDEPLTPPRVSQTQPIPIFNPEP